MHYQSRSGSSILCRDTRFSAKRMCTGTRSKQVINGYARAGSILPVSFRAALLLNQYGVAPYRQFGSNCSATPGGGFWCQRFAPRKSGFVPPHRNSNRPPFQQCHWWHFMHAVQGFCFRTVSQYALRGLFWQLLKPRRLGPFASPRKALRSLQIIDYKEEDFQDSFLLIYFVVALIVFPC